MENVSVPNINLTYNLTGGQLPISGELTVFAKATISLQMILMVFIVSSNLLVLAALCRFQTLRDVTGLFVANLAVADLIIGLSMPFQVAFFLYPEMERIKNLCILRYLVITFACNASIYSLVCTVVDRLIAISYPLHYAQIMTQTKAMLLIAAIWFIDIIFQSIPLFGVNNYDTSPFCLFELVMNEQYRFVNFLSGLLFAFLMLLIYIRIFCIVRYHLRRIRAENAQNPSQSQTRSSSQMNTVIAMVVLIFHISWLPFFITELTMIKAEDVTQQKVVVANFCVFPGLINSVVNPVIYAWKNKQYRSAFRKLLRLKAMHEDSTTISTVPD